LVDHNIRIKEATTILFVVSVRTELEPKPAIILLNRIRSVPPVKINGRRPTRSVKKMAMNAPIAPTSCTTVA
jgi:hypothetical protein